MLLRRENRFHDLAVQQAAQGANIGQLRVMFVPHGMRKAAPGQSELRLDQRGNGGFMGYGAGPRLVLVLFQVISVRGDGGENRLRRTECRNSIEHGEDVHGIDPAGLETQMHGDIACGRHISHAGGSQQSLARKFFAPVFFHFTMPGLLATDVHVVAAGFETGFDDSRAVVEERTHCIADDSGAGEKLGEIVHRSGRF